MKAFFTSSCISMIFCFTTLSAQSNAVFSIRNNETGALLTMRTIVEGESNSVYAIGQDNMYYGDFLIKLDNNGQLVWQKKLQTAFSLGVVSYNQITFYNNEVYILATISDGFSLQYLLTKTDMNGNLVWSKSLFPICQTAYWGRTPSMSIKSNSGITISSSTYESIDIFSLTTDGTTNWIRNFTTDSSFEVGMRKNPSFDITVTDEGNIMGCGKSESDMSFYCMGSDGNVKWAKRVLEMDNSYTHVKSIVEINTNKFLICGFRYTTDMWNYKGFYAFIDSSGSFLDFRLVNELYEIKTGIVLNDGNILLDAFDAVGYRVHLVIDDLGNVIAGYSSPTIAPGSYDFNDVTTTTNYTYFANGQTIEKVSDFNSSECLNLVSQPITFTGDDPGSTPNSGYFAMNTPGTISDYLDAQLVASDLQIEVGCGFIGIEENNASSIHIFPTALNNGESIYVNSPALDAGLENTQLDYQIIDINGRMVTQQPLVEISIPINGFSAGMYIIQFAKNGNVVHSEKFIVVN